MNKLRTLGLATFLLITSAAWSQATRPQSCTLSAAQSCKLGNANGAYGASFEEIPAGSPTTVSVTIQGCMQGNTCDAAADTNVNTTAVVRGVTFTKVYDYFLVTAGTLSGGVSPTMTINSILSTANAHTSGGGSFTAGGDLSGTSTTQQVVGILNHVLPSLTTGNLSWNGSAWAFNVVGSGTVTSVAQTVPAWLTVAGSPITTSGTLAITAATGQTSHQVIGTCGAATTFAPCALVAGDLPLVPLTTGVTGILPTANGGTGINNTATLTLGTSNQNWSTLGTGIVKTTVTTGALSDAAAADVYGLFTSCTGSSGFFLKDGGTCAAAGGGTTSNALTGNNSGSGAASGSTFNGSAAVTFSYNTFGAAPTASPTFTGTVTTPLTTAGLVTTTSGGVLGSEAIATSAQGGTGVANTATLTLGTSNQNWATLGTGIVKNTTTTGALSDAAAADIYNLFTGCTGSSGFFLKDGGTCTSGGSGVTSVAETVPSGFSVAGSPITTSGTLAITYNVSGAGQVINSTGSNAAGFTVNPTLGLQGTTAGSLTVMGTSGTSGSVVINGGTSGAATLSASATGGTLLAGATTFSGTVTTALTTAGLVTTTSGGVLGSEAAATASQGGCGLVNPAANSILIAEGSSNCNLLTSPTTNGYYQVGFNVTASAAVDPTATLPGIPIDATNPATLLYSDRGNMVKWSTGSTLTLPAISGNFASNMAFVVPNTSGGTLALTPTTPNNIDGGTSQAVSNVLNNWAAFTYSDVAGPNWFTIKLPMLAAFPACADSAGNHLNFTAAGNFTCGTTSSGGTPTFPVTVAGTVTSGGIPYFNSTTQESSSALLTQFGVVLGGGVGGAPTSTAQGALGTFLSGQGASAPTFITLSAINPQTATYQVLASDFSGYKTIVVASGTFTITLVASGSQPAAGQYINVLNYGNGTVTIARSGQNINGAAANYTLSPGSASAPTSSQIWSDATNYFAQIDEATVGTVNSVATTGPITGGTFTTSGTIACPTCVTSSASLANGGLVLGTAGTQASATNTQLTFVAPTLTVGLAGTSSGILALTGSTSGQVTLTAPAVAGTATNPLAISNAITLGTAPTVTTPGTGFYVFGTDGTEPASLGSGTSGWTMDSVANCPVQWNNSANVGCSAAVAAVNTFTAPGSSINNYNVNGATAVQTPLNAIGIFNSTALPVTTSLANIQSLNGLATDATGRVIAQTVATLAKLNNVYVVGNGTNTNLATTVSNAPAGGTVYCPPGYSETDTATIAVNKSLHIILDACTITNNGASTPLFTVTASNVTIEGWNNSSILLTAFGAYVGTYTGTVSNFTAKGLTITGNGNNTGTVTINNGSPTVTGQSTNFPTSIVGGTIEVPQAGSSVPYIGTVQTWNSATSLTLTVNWANPTVTTTPNWTMVNQQAGFQNASGQTLSNFRFEDNEISNVMLGISVNADLGGNVDGVLYQGNHLSNVFGLQSGEGYCLHFANGNTVTVNTVVSYTASDVRIIGNHTNNCQRHDIYFARGSGGQIIGNTSENHRSTVQAGTQLPPFEINRSTEVSLVGNIAINPSDGCVSVDSGNLARDNNVLVANNECRNVGGFYPIVVGTTNPATDGFPAGVTISNNRIWQDQSVTGGFGGSLITVQSGKRVNVNDNDIYALNLANGTSMFQVAGSGETSGTTTYNDDVQIRNNHVYATLNGGTAYGIEFKSAAAGSGMTVGVRGQRYNGVLNANSFLFDATQQSSLLISTLDTLTGGLDLTKTQPIVPGGPFQFQPGMLLSSAVGGTDVGSAALPFGNLWLTNRINCVSSNCSLNNYSISGSPAIQTPLNSLGIFNPTVLPVTTAQASLANTSVLSTNSLGQVVPQTLISVPQTNSTSVTASNPTAATDTIMMAIPLPAGYLNVTGAPFHLIAAGVLSTTAASSPQVTFTPKICSVPGCATGTVTPLAAIQSSALNTTAITNATWIEELDLIVASNGASCNFIVKGKLSIDLGAAVAATPDTVFVDSNTAVSSPNQICNNTLYLDFFVQQSTTGASNSYKQLLGIIR